MYTDFDIFLLKVVLIGTIGIIINRLIYYICIYYIKRPTTPTEIKELYESEGVKEVFSMCSYFPFLIIPLIVIPYILSIFGVKFSDDDK